MKAITLWVVARLSLSVLRSPSMSTLGLENAISKAGGQVALAALLGIRQSHISNWKNRGKRVPAEWVLKIERATGVSRHELRPDLYPLEASSA